MLGLLRVLRKQPNAASASWHLLFRRNIYAGRPSQYLAQDEGLRQLRNQFRYVAEQANNAVRVFFYTDTEQLSEQYERLGVAPFKSLPVPAGADYRPEQKKRSSSDCPNIAYIGDAREEKGYQYLPRLVQDLWRDHIEPGRARCTFQSNYNTASGEPPAVVSRCQLGNYPPDKVRLLLEPLGPDAYRDLILGADVALLPYDRDNYYARSSGVFTEAIAAGVPVVVPAGSWMALQFAPAAHAYHLRLLQGDDLPRQTVPGEDLTWRSHGQKGKLTLQDGVLQLGGESAHYCSMTAPEGAGYLLVCLTQQCDHPGEFVRIEVQSRIPESPDYGVRCHSVVGGIANQPTSALLRLGGDRRIRIVFRCALDKCSQTLGDIKFHFLPADVPLPLSAAGVTYDGPAQLSEAVREILANLEHYTRTAAELSAEWSAYNHPGTLVATLTERTPVEGAGLPPLALREDFQPAKPVYLRKAS